MLLPLLGASSGGLRRNSHMSDRNAFRPSAGSVALCARVIIPTLAVHGIVEPHGDMELVGLHLPAPCSRQLLLTLAIRASVHTDRVHQGALAALAKAVHDAHMRSKPDVPATRAYTTRGITVRLRTKPS